MFPSEWNGRVSEVAVASGSTADGQGGGAKLILYQQHVRRTRTEARLNTPLEELYVEVAAQALPPNRRSITLRVEGENHVGRVALPLINYCFDDVLLKRHQGAESAAWQIWSLFFSLNSIKFPKAIVVVAQLRVRSS